MNNKRETVEGYVVDLACIRKYPRSELLTRARQHTVACALKGHCVESGYGLVNEEDTLTLLDPAATPHLVPLLDTLDRESASVWVRAMREMQDEAMTTVGVQLRDKE